MQNKTVLITGASSGIGRELARLFAQNTYNLVLVARNQERLEAIARELEQKYGVTVLTVSKDLTDPKAPEEIFQELKNKNIVIDTLINNAGFGNLGPFHETPLSEELDMIQVNVMAVTTLTKLFLQDMVQRNHGHILNVASTAAFQPGPFMAVYFATKAYVLFFTEAIAEELKGTNVHVSVLCPGPTQTDFQARAFQKQSPSWGYMNVERVAKVAYEGLNQKKTLIIPGLKNKLFIIAVRLTPRSVVTRVLGKIIR